MPEAKRTAFAEARKNTVGQVLGDRQLGDAVRWSCVLDRREEEGGHFLLRTQI